ncbi:glycosyltransferase [Rubritalea profundi]|uniref:Glucuronosyltransferase GumK N-terminal domain-containing protein n=1 Tax=Rubritalea profundi TaxID=1658618 RepID=A0A2S7TZ91_9BACT|nr:glycosyltransferase [Rubritalea profundi]PQJ28059.1 hypothetical protein BSZ32_05785 [Rubritalea profundi]
MSTVRESVLIVSFHDWKSKRLAGFHKIGESLLEAGYDVGFAAHSRPLYAAFLNKDEINCFKNWKALMGGKHFKWMENELVNFTALNIEIPGFLRKGLMAKFNMKMKLLSNVLLAKKCKRMFPAPKCVIIESGTSVCAFSALKKRYPNTPFIYRPSDPCIGALRKDPFLIAAERKIVQLADKVLLVNELGRELYMKNGYDLDTSRTFILPNGIDIESFREKCQCPKELLSKPSACYLGGHVPNWRAIFALAELDNDLNVVVICPEKLTAELTVTVNNYSNITYIEGVDPERVPEYITNTEVVMIPYPDGWSERPLGMHGKVMQAMCANKPIVGLNLDVSLREEGVYVTDSVERFAQAVCELKDSEPVQYAYDFSERDWAHFKKTFIQLAGL